MPAFGEKRTERATLATGADRGDLQRRRRLSEGSNGEARPPCQKSHRAKREHPTPTDRDLPLHVVSSFALLLLERFPVGWTHVNHKKSLELKKLGHVLVEKVVRLFRDILYTAKGDRGVHSRVRHRRIETVQDK
jgi:hypothetical protein